MAYEELIARLEAPWSRVTAIEERTYANGRVEMVNPLLREAAAAMRWLQNSAAATDEAITWANGHLDTIIAERDALRVEIAALRKDAERYRWLLVQTPHTLAFLKVDDLSASIDAAMEPK